MVGWSISSHVSSFSFSFFTPLAGTAHAHHVVKVKPGMLFVRNTIVPGSVLAEGMTFGAGRNNPTSRTFAFKKDAKAIPFASQNITSILRTFQIPPCSKKAEQIAYTLETCEESAPAGELQTCATSAEAMQEFASAALGSSNPQKLVTVVRGATEPARYVVAPNGITKIGGGKQQQGAVACHPMPYPYTVHYCHAPRDVQAYRVELTGADDGNSIMASAIAMCHTNTTTWDDHFFQLLNATRGDVICHFMALNYVLWMASPAA